MYIIIIIIIIIIYSAKSHFRVIAMHENTKYILTDIQYMYV